MITVSTGPLSIDDVVAVARHDEPIRLSDEARAGIAATRQDIDKLAEQQEPVYGVSTGFGALARRHIPHEQRKQLQRSLVRSHAAGSGILWIVSKVLSIIWRNRFSLRSPL